MAWTLKLFSYYAPVFVYNFAVMSALALYPFGDSKIIELSGVGELWAYLAEVRSQTPRMREGVISASNILRAYGMYMSPECPGYCVYNSFQRT